MTHIITVDGPSGSGKGTICRILANQLGFALLDSGAIYRIAALAALKSQTDLSDEIALLGMCATLQVRFDTTGDNTRVYLNGEDVSQAIREEQTGMAASKIAVLPKVREALLARQKAFAEPPGLVADGRDMGTVVFPDAGLKVFLTASAEERAQRRVLQLQGSGVVNIDQAKILADIQARDAQDMNRAAAPLKPATDAIQIDSTNLTIEQVVAAITTHIRF